MTTAANSCVPVKRLGVQKSWWSDELDELKQETIDATNVGSHKQHHTIVHGL